MQPPQALRAQYETGSTTDRSGSLLKHFHLFHPSLRLCLSSIISAICTQIRHILACSLLIYLPAKYELQINFRNTRIIACQLNTPASGKVPTYYKLRVGYCECCKKKLVKKMSEIIGIIVTMLRAIMADCILLLSYRWHS
jgi:hypothetical protein